jgi:hypothetical protein
VVCSEEEEAQDVEQEGDILDDDDDGWQQNILMHLASVPCVWSLCIGFELLADS